MNRNSNKSSIVTTVVVFLVCLVLITGSTFSLFTSKTGTNIAVTSGKVEMVATIDASTLALYSKGAAQTGKFANGGTAAFNDAKTELTLTNITPGDSVEFDIVLENKSTVDLQYRVNWIVSGDLAEALTATVGGADITSGTSEWTLWKADAAEKSQTLKIAIELPLEADDNWESLEANIAFNVEAVQANATGEYSPVAFVSSAAGLQAAIDAGCTEIHLNDNITLDQSIVIPAQAATFSAEEIKPVVLNLNGKTITGTKGRDADNNRIHVIVNNGILTIKDGTVKSAGNDGGSAIYNNAGATLTIEDVTLYGAPQSDPVYEAGVSKPFPSYAVNNYGNAVVNGATIKSYHGAIATGGNGVTVINDADIDVGLGQSTGITSYLIYSYDNAQVTVNDGKFAFTKQEIYVNGGNTFCELGINPIIINGGNYTGTSFSTGADREYVIKGGTFDVDPSTYVAEGCVVINNNDGTYSVYANASDSTITLKDGAVLDLGGVEFAGKVVVEGNVTIKGDTKIKTLSSTEGATITIEDGKTLTLNNFSFGTKNNASAKYVVTGGTLTANYGFFQHGTYDLYSNIETGYMYYSFGSNITVYGTVHSQGKGDGLDYVRGTVTIAKGGKSIHDRALWVGQPASWGPMNATLIVEEGGYVQAKSLSVYAGSSLLLNPKNIVDGVDNSVVATTKKYEGTVKYVVSSNEELQAALDSATDGMTIQLIPGVNYDTVYIGRPTKNNDTTMFCETHSFTTTDAEAFKAHLADGQWHTTPRYTTSLKNLTVIGAEGATVAGIVATSGHAYGDVNDYVLDKDYDVGSAYYNTLFLENIVFSNVNFTGKIDINTSDATSVYDGITFDACTFTTGGTASDNGAAIRYYNEANNGNVKNIVVDNCTFNNCNQGIYVHHVNGVTVTDCTFDITGHNAIAIQGHDGAVDLKNVVITGNTFNNIGDRVVRFNNVGADSSITIQNNTATNSGDEDGEVMKATSIEAGVTTNISGNTWNGIVVNTELQDK